MEAEKPIPLKVCTIGEIGVGKRSLLTREVDNVFKEGGCNEFLFNNQFLFKEYLYIERKYRINYWGAFSAAEMFLSLVQLALKEASGVFIIVSVEDENVIKSLTKWRDEICKCVHDVPIFVLCNKIDKDPNFDFSAIKQFCESNHFRLYETSAKDGTNVHEAFQDMFFEIVSNPSFINRTSKKNRKSRCI